MAEEELSESPSGESGGLAGADTAAMALALDGASREEADAFLKKQGALIDDQRHHLNEQFKHQLNQLRLGTWEKRLGVFLRGATAVIGLAFAGGVAFMVWDASQSEGLVIQAFSVPPDLAARGLTGEVVAGQLLDKIGMVQRGSPMETSPNRALSGGWGDDIKVEIPDTGVSLGEAYRFVQDRMGHETVISGDVFRTPDGFAVTVRLGDDGATYAGPESGLDELIQKAAEHVIDVTQPARYDGYLLARNPPRLAEARAVLERATGDTGLPLAERAHVWNNLGIFYRRLLADERTASAMSRQALAVLPDYTVAIGSLADIEQRLGHSGAALVLMRDARASLDRHAVEFFPDAAAALRADYGLGSGSLLGDFGEAARQAQGGVEAGPSRRRDYYRRFVAELLADQHDGGALAMFIRMPPPPTPADGIARTLTRFRIDAALEHWSSVIAWEAAAENAIARVGTFVPQEGKYDVAILAATQLRPQLALAKARTDDVAGAEAVIAATPADCYDCIRTRGVIASEARQWGRADYWFARAVHDGPFIPFAYENWGRSLLDRNQSSAAIEQFKASNAKGPHFADPLEGWGEALMAQNRSDLALAKFSEAAKYAPNWGRLHLKWGEALSYAGKKDEAQKQFGRAGALDLTASEKSELAKAGGHV